MLFPYKIILMLEEASFLDLGKNRNMRNMIVLILAVEWPLTIAQIYKRLVRSYGISCSYQAVFRQVKEMLAEGLLTADNTGYRLNEDWLQSLNKFITDIIERYKTNPQGVLGRNVLKEKSILSERISKQL